MIRDDIPFFAKRIGPRNSSLRIDAVTLHIKCRTCDWSMGVRGEGMDGATMYDHCDHCDGPVFENWVPDFVALENVCFNGGSAHDPR